MKLEELRWATGEYSKHAQPAAQRYQEPDYEDQVLVQVDTERFIDNLDPDYKVDDMSEIKGRTSRAKEHWKSGGFMDPILAYYMPHRDSFGISDGRHRLVAAYQMGEKAVPLLIPDYQLDIFKEKIGARE